MTRFLTGVLVAQLVLAGLLLWQVQTDFALFRGSDDAERSRTAVAATPRLARFDAPRAFALIREQTEIGPRPAGSPQSRRLASRLAKLLPAGRLERVAGHPKLRNVVGRLPGRAPALVIGAHFDTKDIPGGFVGAEDAAGGTAAVVEIARALRRDTSARHREVRFVLFDGEEAPRDGGDFYTDGLRGSKAYAKRNARAIGDLVLLDFVAQKGLSTPREQGSDPELWAALRSAARRAGTLRHFPAAARGEIQDDHTPFVRRGVRAIDLIDFDYPYWHTLGDTLDKLSVASLDASGETVVELARMLRR